MEYDGAVARAEERHLDLAGTRGAVPRAGEELLERLLVTGEEVAQPAVLYRLSGDRFHPPGYVPTRRIVPEVRRLHGVERILRLEIPAFGDDGEARRAHRLHRLVGLRSGHFLDFDRHVGGDRQDGREGEPETQRVVRPPEDVEGLLAVVVDTECDELLLVVADQVVGVDREAAYARRGGHALPRTNPAVADRVEAHDEQPDEVVGVVAALEDDDLLVGLVEVQVGGDRLRRDVLRGQANLQLRARVAVLFGALARGLRREDDAVAAARRHDPPWFLELAAPRRLAAGGERQHEHEHGGDRQGGDSHARSILNRPANEQPL